MVPRINAESLATWASLGRTLRTANQKIVPSWLSVQRLIDVTQPVLQKNRDEARRLLEESNNLLAPLKDPLETRLGLHRWLSGEREEVYSDWLAWIIEQLATPEKIVPLLCGENAAELIRQCAGALNVHRETVFVTAKSVRRTDIEICFGEKRAILVEVKMVEAHKVAADQLYDQGHYGKAFEKRLLLVPSGEVDTASKGVDFELVLWRDVCLRLRKLVPSICRENISIAAMILAFLGAVEQNVLQLPSAGEWYRVTSATLDFLTESMGGNNIDA
jgi:hypothetical protein